jgi:hypothetical protein
VWLSLGGLFPSLHKRNDTPVFSVKWAQGDGPPKNSDRIGSQRIHSVSLPSPSSGGRFQLRRVPNLKLRLTVESEEAALPATARFHLPSPWQRANVCCPKSFDRSTRLCQPTKTFN